MPLLTLDEAADRVGVPRTTIDEWVQGGLLRLQKRPRSDELPPDVLGLLRLEDCVDEEELFAKAENLGWFVLGAENWDSVEDK
jgi:hypothetical protein